MWRRLCLVALRSYLCINRLFSDQGRSTFTSSDKAQGHSSSPFVYAVSNQVATAACNFLQRLLSLILSFPIFLAASLPAAFADCYRCAQGSGKASFVGGCDDTIALAGDLKVKLKARL